jgi:hypothetical protein
MNTITIKRRLDEPIDALPELDAFVGHEVEIVVKDHGVTNATPGRKRAGFIEGEVWTSDDFDAPLDDFKDYM